MKTTFTIRKNDQIIFSSKDASGLIIPREGEIVSTLGKDGCKISGNVHTVFNTFDVDEDTQKIDIYIS